MALAVSTAPARARRIALLVMNSGGQTALCPFFGKCDGLLVVDTDSGAAKFHACERPSPKSMCDLILRTDADGLVLGFVAGAAARKLRSAGIDIRLGSCACAVQELAAHFDDLPAP